MEIKKTPLVKIEIIQGNQGNTKKLFINGVHKALVHALKIIEYDLYQSLYELDADYFEYPPDKRELKH